ncbi:MAG: hypothetical protein HYS87_03590 [Candidatus Colwellbacteria bacterium]|nr:hypothetical protein [Candidatus Colwellbacteria bacterium]
MFVSKYILPFIVLAILVATSGAVLITSAGHDSVVIGEFYDVRIIPIIAGLVLIALTYFVSRINLGRWWALLPAVLIASSPAFLTYARYFTVDIFGALIFLIAVFVILRLAPAITYRRIPKRIKPVQYIAWIAIFASIAALVTLEWQRTNGFADFLANDIEFWRNYLLKESIPIMILTAFGIIWLICRILKEGVKLHLEETVMLVMLALYKLFIVSESLTTYSYFLLMLPLVYILASLGIKDFIADSRTKVIGLAAFLLWHGASMGLAYPNFSVYINEIIAAAPHLEQKITAQYDLGQDLKRFSQYVEENNISKIALDYFGEDSPEKHLGEKYVEWQSSYRSPKEKDIEWFGVSFRNLYEARSTSSGQARDPENQYLWLLNWENPTAKVGNIWIYKIQ